ncbi:MAG: hypothetical protein JO112_10290 [Planctomycetes bacterium]|nr:hypothetical protein [Planctomycetota bacterium]
MKKAENRRSPIYRQLEVYEDSWKMDHEAAMGCRDWEDAIAVGIGLFGMLREREQAWRDQVFRGTVPFLQEDNLDHQGRFADWLDTTREVLAQNLPELEQRFGTVAGASQLHACAELAGKILLEWQPPRLSMAVGLREQTLSPEAAVELDRIIEEAKRTPLAMPTRRLETRGPDFLRK